MGERRDSGFGGIGSNGHGVNGDGRVFDELDVLSDEDLELLAGGVEDEEELRALTEEAEAALDPPEADDADDARSGTRSDRRSSEEREQVARRLFPDWEYEPVPGLSADWTEDPGVPTDGAAWEGDGARAGIARARQLLAPIEEALRREEFYAYGTLDEENRWTVAVDDEAGRVDVRLDPDGYLLDLRATSPGLYADVEHPFRRRRLERAARDHLPRIARGALPPHQTTDWDEVDQGVAVGIRYLIPFARADEVGRIVRQRLPELEDLLTLVEERVTE
jgi:hypothetical protein